MLPAAFAALAMALPCPATDIAAHAPGVASHCIVVSAAAGVAPASIDARARHRPSGDLPTPGIAVSVDRRVELMAIVARLALFEEFSASGIAAYDAAVATHFDGFSDHPAVDLLRTLRRERGIGFGDTVALALLAEPDDWTPRLPLPVWLSHVSTQWDAASASALLEAMPGFARDSDAAGFFAAQASLYAQVVEQIDAGPRAALDRGWFTGIAADGRPLRLRIVAGLLHGRGNYGPRILMADGTVEAHAVISPAGEGSGWSDPRTVRLLVHEFAHSLVNPWVDLHADALEPAARALYAGHATQMRRSAYGDWKTLLYESLTRAVTQRYFLDHGAHEQRQAADAQDRRAGFGWIPALADLLPAQAPLLHPGLVPGIEALLLEHAGSDAGIVAPTVSLLPAPGDVAVDPQRDHLLLRFDQPMSGDIGLFGDHVPAVTGTPRWSDDGSTLRIPVELVPGSVYLIQLNHPDMPGGFGARTGVPLSPLTWRFRTRPR